jgi:hypothetical protein
MSASRRSLSQATFVDKIDVMTRAAIIDGVTSFETLLRRLPAVYPTEVLASLIGWHHAARSRRLLRTTPGNKPAKTAGLPSRGGRCCHSPIRSTSSGVSRPTPHERCSTVLLV